MNRFWKDVGIAITMGWILPAIILTAVVSLSGKKQEIPALTEPIVTIEPLAEQARERGEVVSLLDDDGRVREITLRDYLTGVVLAEMPVSFEDEALKAQVVVARTYTMRAMTGGSKHSEADVCVNSWCCQGYRDVDAFLEQGGKGESVQRVQSLVSETDGEVLTYDGDLIEATYFSCSGGITEDAVAVWGTDVPYLRSVISPGEEYATHYTDSMSFETDVFATKLGIDLEGDPETWFTDVRYTSGGGVENINVGGKDFSGPQLRQLLGLRSTAFTVSAQEDEIIFYTRGYGHRVGMSQYGADAMAARGSTYDQILAYYYQGTELVNDFH